MKLYPTVYDGDTVFITSANACCHCGLVHDFEALPRKKGEHAKMKVWVNKRATAALRRYRKEEYRAKLRAGGLL